VDLKTATFKTTATACGRTQAINAAIVSFNALDAPGKVGQLGQNWLNSKDKAEKDYDDQTHHGLIRAKQAAWEGKIAAGLTEYDLNAPPPRSTPATPATTPAPAPPAPGTP
jgi:hypothetical protein